MKRNVEGERRHVDDTISSGFKGAERHYRVENLSVTPRVSIKLRSVEQTG